MSKRLEFVIEFGQPVLRVYHGFKVQSGSAANISKLEFEDMRFFKAFPSQYIERLIAGLWNNPGEAISLFADDRFWEKLAEMEAREKAVA